MQAALDHNRNFSRFTKLDHIISLKGFGGTDCQCTAIGQQIMRILNHIMTEGITAQCALCQLLVKRQGQGLLIKFEVTLPYVLRETHTEILSS